MTVVTYVPLGYPTLADSLNLITELDGMGVDVIEIGVPFSDPTADGETIQRAAKISLDNGVVPSDALKVPALKARKYLMTYGNIILKFGNLDRLVDSGYEGVIIPDVPIEHKLETPQLDQVMIVSPNSVEGRIRELSAKSEGFLYITSHLGTTGGKAELDQRLRDVLQIAEDENPHIPKYVGFGITDPQRAADILSMGADGVVIGSAMIRAIDEGGISAGADFIKGFLDHLK